MFDRLPSPVTREYDHRLGTLGSCTGERADGLLDGAVVGALGQDVLHEPGLVSPADALAAEAGAVLRLQALAQRWSGRHTLLLRHVSFPVRLSIGQTDNVAGLQRAAGDDGDDVRAARLQVVGRQVCRVDLVQKGGQSFRFC
jgi:hypothetical protein